MIDRRRGLCFITLVATPLLVPPARTAGTLDIYWIDVEGGAGTLVVSPNGESLLYDAGWEPEDAMRGESPPRYQPQG